MDTKDEIKKTEEAISSIDDFIYNHYHDIDQKTVEAWSDAKKGFVEVLYYMIKFIRNKLENSSEFPNSSVGS